MAYPILSSLMYQTKNVTLWVYLLYISYTDINIMLKFLNYY